MKVSLPSSTAIDSRNVLSLGSFAVISFKMPFDCWEASQVYVSDQTLVAAGVRFLTLHADGLVLPMRRGR